MPHKGRKCKPFPSDTIKQLSSILSKISQHTCVILLGDMNCKLGRNIDNLTGKWCAHKHSNAEGEIFLDLMRRFNLTATSTFFQPPRKKSNVTYMAKDPSCKPSQIDYIMVSSRWTSSVRDCKVNWGVSCQRWGRHYDHGLIRGIVKSRIAVSKAEPVRDFSQLKTDNDIKIRFEEAVRENLSRSEFDQSNPSDSLINLQHSIIAAASSVLPSRKALPLRKRQVSSHTRDLYESRKINF